jgi:hypothetical protein
VARMGEERKLYKGLVGSPKERDHWEDRGADRLGSEWILGGRLGVVEWIQLAQDRDRWWTVVNTVMNLRVLAPRS